MVEFKYFFRTGIVSFFCIPVFFVNSVLADWNNSEPIIPLPTSITLNPLKVSLGELLFNDVILSQLDTMSCANCHQLQHGGDDGLVRSITNSGVPDLNNAPTVFNVVYNFRQTWRGEFRTLEQQAKADLNNPRHSRITIPEVIEKLKKDKTYVLLFNKTYSNGLNENNLLNAIAEYERSLITPGSRFDQFLKGDENAITKIEKSGYALFKSYGCISCHQGINIGGNMFQKFGIINNYFVDKKITSADLGRFKTTKVNEDKHVFKVPSLRNVEVTAPYFHDGSAEDLETAIKVMAKYQLGIIIPDGDIKKLIAFLATLTGKYKGKFLHN